MSSSVSQRLLLLTPTDPNAENPLLPPLVSLSRLLQAAHLTSRCSVSPLKSKSLTLCLPSRWFVIERDGGVHGSGAKAIKWAHGAQECARRKCDVTQSEPPINSVCHFHHKAQSVWTPLQEFYELIFIYLFIYFQRKVTSGQVGEWSASVQKSRVSHLFFIRFFLFVCFLLTAFLANFKVILSISFLFFFLFCNSDVFIHSLCFSLDLLVQQTV